MVAVPPLGITADGSRVMLSWPAIAEDYVLQVSDDLGSSSQWLMDGNPRVVVGSQLTVTVKVTLTAGVSTGWSSPSPDFSCSHGLLRPAFHEHEKSGLRKTAPPQDSKRCKDLPVAVANNRGVPGVTATVCAESRPSLLGRGFPLARTSLAQTIGWRHLQRKSMKCAG